ncbi:DUF927 domain-containing protein [Pontibacterium sp. N1Y112]|uniref:DUF927 domain-containing protein n=1 Tax=Pontibacterium sinense TaxID=2781979 RepID=A0A8J7JXX4_9GAMM|nr:DUF927 domain-containing protein [Pontibacterium sinense]MBE9395654.1 DUF927 domain-containing protein [Pontibacterium sinense]
MNQLAFPPVREGYELNEDGTFKLVPSGKKDQPPKLVQLAYQPVWVDRQIYDNDSGGNWFTRLSFRTNAGFEQQCLISAGDLAGNHNAVCSQLGKLGVYVSPDLQLRREFIKYLMLGAATPPQPTVDQFGLHLGSGAFLLPQETIIPSWATQPVPELSAERAQDVGAIHQAGSFEEWQAIIAQAGTPLNIFMLSLAFTCVISRLMNAEAIGVHAYGGSSNGKTNSARIAASVFGNPGLEGASFIDKWYSSDNGIELKCKARDGLTLILDELRQFNGRFEAVTYTIFDGKGKTRMNGDLQRVQELSWFVNVISTGEFSAASMTRMTGGAVYMGAQIRLLDLPMMEMNSDSEVTLTSAEADRLRHALNTQYGTAGPEYVRRLFESSSSLDELRNKVGALMDEIGAELAPLFNKGNAVQRVLPKFALIQTAGEIAVDLGILPYTVEQVQGAVKSAIQAWLEGLEAPSDAERAVNALRSSVIENPQRIHYLRTDYQSSAPPVCYADRNFYYFTDEQIKKVIDHVTPTTVAKTLRDQGLLHTDEARRLKVKRAIPGFIKDKEPRVYAVHNSFIGEPQPTEPDDPVVTAKRKSSA